jgi:hypothetical protein
MAVGSVTVSTTATAAASIGTPQEPATVKGPRGRCGPGWHRAGSGFRSTPAGPQPRRPGLGLVSLGERVRMLGGELEVATQPDAGTRIAVHLPAADARAS